MSEPIEKKTWPKFFELMLEGKKNVDVRLADFNLEDGDEILFREYDPKTKEYTGRSFVRKVTSRARVNFTSFNTISEILQYGHWVIEFDRPTDFTLEELEEISEWCENVADYSDMPRVPTEIPLYNRIIDKIERLRD